MNLPDFEQIAPYLTHPLVLVGFILFLVFGIHKLLIKSKIIPPLSETSGSTVVLNLLHYGFIIALVIILAGFTLEGLKTFINANGEGAIKSSVPRFDKVIGQLEEGQEFIKFTEANIGKIVQLDTYIWEENFYGDVEQSFFTIWDKCFDKLLPGEKLGSNKCTGYSYRIEAETPSDYVFQYYRGKYELNGYFIIRDIYEFQHGLLPVTLVPVNIKDVLLK